jgi:hypothetical protein
VTKCVFHDDGTKIYIMSVADLLNEICCSWTLIFERPLLDVVFYVYCCLWYYVNKIFFKP